MERPEKGIVPKRRRGGRRKGEKRVVYLGPWALLKLFYCRDFDVLLDAPKRLGVRPYVSGYGDRRFVSVGAHELPIELQDRARAIEAEENERNTSCDWLNEDGTFTHGDRSVLERR